MNFFFDTAERAQGYFYIKKYLHTENPMDGGA